MDRKNSINETGLPGPVAAAGSSWLAPLHGGAPTPECLGFRVCRLTLLSYSLNHPPSSLLAARFSAGTPGRPWEYIDTGLAGLLTDCKKF